MRSRPRPHSRAWTSRLRRPVSARSTTGSWKTTLLARRASSGRAATSKLARRARPEVGAMVVVSMPTVVDLPAPLGPSRPKTSPGATSKEMSFTAWTPPGYVLVRWWTSITWCSSLGGRHIGRVGFVTAHDGSRREDVTVTEDDWLAAEFEAQRPHMQAIAYRMLGSASEAEDAVQEAWLRLSRAGSVDNLGGWLTTVVGRVCLDILRARRARPERAAGSALPEPIVSIEEAGPEHEALLADSVALALLVVLDTLTPAERLAFVLHDM